MIPLDAPAGWICAVRRPLARIPPSERGASGRPSWMIVRHSFGVADAWRGPSFAVGLSPPGVNAFSVMIGRITGTCVLVFISDSRVEAPQIAHVQYRRCEASEFTRH